MSTVTVVVVVPMLVFAAPISVSQYADGVMEEVIANRQRWGQIPEHTHTYTGFLAAPYAETIGEVRYLTNDGLTCERFLVVDCGGVADGGRAWMLRNDVAYEVDYQTAERWDTVGRMHTVRGCWPGVVEVVGEVPNRGVMQW